MPQLIPGVLAPTRTGNKSVARQYSGTRSCLPREVENRLRPARDDRSKLTNQKATHLKSLAGFLWKQVAENRIDYIDLVCGEMLRRAGPHARWVDAFCETGAFDADQCRAVLEAGRAAGLGLRLHGNQLGHGPGVQLAVECGCASVDHCTYLTDADIEALAAGSTVATFLPATDFSTRQPYPDARRVIDAGATVAIASNCNPGSSYTTSISFCIALAVRDMHMTIDEAVQAATIGGAAALRRADVGRLSPGAAGHAVILDAPTHHHLAYRPGVPLIRDTIGPLRGR